MIAKQMKSLIPAALPGKQKALLMAATKLFHRYGFGKVSVEELCRHAAVSKVTFYRYYRGKDGLILHILQILFDDMIRQSNELLEGERSLKEKFDGISLMKQEFMTLLGDEMIQGLLSYPAAKDYYEKLTKENYEILKTFLYREREQGSINANLNIELFLAILMDLSRMFTARSLEQYSSSFKDLVAQVNEILIYGLINREQE